ncbi:phosphodiester glycosidase family protein [Saccharopolyspora sp. HNM0986]|uniref:phosphodiester glycosidase family protein n=1 Tax=Saccharopolyspora galaxeae TaxID=2781241 RepID=UPI0019091B15|nr:phosphodiester glycosidase family protein [Saccharopolyspora sp. HNM0986]MBK0868554.1 phosphodiester glycosidase family protein [Saccharopolyspora sp. HNM0986]
MRSFAVVLSGVVLAGGLSVPNASAAVPTPPVEDGPAASVLEKGPVSVRAGGRDRSEGVETARNTSPVAPGLSLTEFERYGPDGWLRGDVLTAELSEPGLRPEYLSPGSASMRSPLTEQAARSGAVAGVNGDFFDIDASGAPLGPAMSDGELLSAPEAGNNDVAAVGGRQRAGRLMQLFLEAELTRADGGRTRVTDLNVPKVSDDGIALYTPRWGDASRRSAVDGAHRVTEVEVAGDQVTRVSPAPAEGPVPRGSVRLLGVGAGADQLATVRVGERVGVHYRPRTSGDEPDVAVGGNKVLLRDGAVQQVDDTALHPRTAAGFSADGQRMWLVTIDGRQAASRGMTELELAEQLRRLGADDAINLDGGGSSTLLARPEGGSAPGVRNSPSEGELRPVPNGLGFSTAPGSGRLRGFRVEPGGGRVLSGLSRRFAAHGHDETGAPVPAGPEWSVTPGRGRIDNGVLRGGLPGTAEVTAHSAAASGSAELTVLGPPVRLSPSVGRVRLAGEGARDRFQILGHDADGFGTWVEPADVRLEYDSNAVRIEPDRDGFAVTALSPSASAVVTARVGDKVTHLGVTTGAQPQSLSTMDDVGGWRPSGFPQPVGASLTQGEGRAGTPGLALDYSLTGSTSTRAAYVNAESALPLPDGTQQVGVWVNGDGRGARLRGTLLDPAGVATTVDLTEKVDWTGWRYVQAPIPAGASGPLRLQRLYAVETDDARQYGGRLVFDDLTASVAPEVDVPVTPQPQDRSVVQDGTLRPAPGAARIAVVSDAQFTADDPAGPLVEQARRALREAVATRPDALVINGDFVDRGTAADFDLARRLIDSEVGDRVPWFYVPGNHEANGPGDLREFTAEFGAPQRVADVAGTRMVSLDSSSGALLGGGFEQVRMLRAALDQARRDPRIRSVAVFLHHPLDDPGAGDASRLADPKEAALLNRWLADFEGSSGKSAALVAAHAGTFHSSTVDGVSLEVNGNSGKAPATAPESGGFTGWSLLRTGPRGVRWETKPNVDRLELAAPANVEVGASVPTTAELFQGDRAVPVRYPVSADWQGSPEVFIGPPEQAFPGAVAAFDPDSGRLTGLRPGRGALSVHVNGARQVAGFTVTRR